MDALVQTGTGLLDKNMYIYCEDDPVNRVDTSGSGSEWVFNGVEYYYDGSAGDFCRLEHGLPPASYERAQEEYYATRSTAQKFVDSVAASIYVNVNSGFGVGAEVEVYGATVGAVAKAKFLNKTIQNLKIQDRPEIEANAVIGIGPLDVGPQYTAGMYDPNESLDWASTDKISILSAEIYCIYGAGFDTGIDINAFMEEWKK